MAEPLQGVTVTSPPPELPQGPGPVSVFEKQNTPLIFDSSIAEERASKYDFGLGPLSPGKDQLAWDVQEGKEDSRRASLAATKDVRDYETRQQILKDIASVRTPGAPITPQEIEIVNSLKPENYEAYRNDPKTFYEKGFADQIINAVQMNGYDEFFRKAFKDINNPPDLKVEIGRTSDLITKQQAFMKLAEEQEAKWKELGIGSKALSIGEGLLPLWNAQRLHNQLVGEGKPLTGLTGSTIETAIENLYRMSPAEAVIAARETVEALAKIDPMLGMSFAQALVSYSSFQKFLDSSMNIADVGTVTSIGGKAGITTARGLNATKNALADIVKSTATRRFDMGDVLDGAGDVSKAGIVKGWEIFSERAARTGNPESLFEIRKELPSMSNPYSVINGYQGSLSNERARRIYGMLVGNNEQFAKAVTNAISVDRLEKGSKALQVAEKATDELFNMQFPRTVDAILDIRTVNQAENLQRGVYRAVEIGKRPEAFPTQEVLADYKPFFEGRRIPPYANDNPVSANTIGNRSGIVYSTNEKTGLTTKVLTSSNDNLAILMGRKNATLFDSIEAADRAAKEDYGLSGYYIRQRGQGYYIEYHKAVNEATADVAQALVTETTNTTPRGMLNWFAGYVGAGNRRVSQVIAGDMSVSTYGSTGLHEMIRSIAQPIQTLKVFSRKQTYKDFIEFAERQRDMINPVTKERGYFSETLHGFEQDWLAHHGYLPSEKISRAYFAYTDLVNKDWMLRNLHMTGNKVRLGLELHDLELSKLGENGELLRVRNTPSIEGRTVKEIPWGEVDSNSGILIHDLDPDKWEFHRKLTQKKGWTQQKKIDHIKELTEKQGYRIIQLSDIGEQTLRDLHGDLLPKGPINYVLTKNSTSAPLGFKQIPYKPGGHVEYPSGWYVAQPKIKHFLGAGDETIKATYYGDEHMHFHPLEGKVRDLTNRYEQARILLKNGSPDLESYLAKNLPYKLDEWKAKFGENGWDINQKFYTKAGGTNLASQYQLANKYKPKVFERASERSDNVYGQSVEMRFAGERSQTLRGDLPTGSAEAPHWNYKPAKLIDPVTVQLRATSDLLRDTYLGDFKWKSANNFVAEFGSLLETAKGEEGSLVRNPIKHLLDPVWRKDIQGEEGALWTAAKNYRRTTLNLLGEKTDFDKTVWAWQQRMANRLSDVLPDKAQAIVEPWLLSRSGDVTRYAKAIGYGMQVGILVPHQLLLQAMTMANTIAFTNPLRAPLYLMKAALMRGLFYTDNPSVIKGFAKMATANGIVGKEEHFIESFEAMKRAGFGKVGGEHVYRDAYFNPPLVEGKMGYAYSWLHGFFNEGERWNRYTAWSASYDRWRSANPFAKFDDAAITDVLRQADMYAGNMSTAGKAAWNKGILSIPTQYAAYPARIAEMYLGKEFTKTERLRAMATYATIFGYGSALGSAAGVWPVGKTIDSYLRDHNIDTDANTFAKVAHDGILSIIAEQALGKQFNVGERLGGAGSDLLRDVSLGKKTLPEALGGASGVLGALQEKPGQSLLVDTAASFGRLLNVPLITLRNYLTGETKDPLTYQRLNDFANNFSGYNAWKRWYLMNNLGQYVTKNGKVMDVDITGKQAFFSLITGTMPETVARSYEIMSDLSFEKDMKGDMMKRASVWTRRAFQAQSQEDFDKFNQEAELYLKAGGLTPIERRQYITQLVHEVGDTEIVKQLIKWGFSNPNKPGRIDYMQRELEKMQKEKENK